MIRVRVRPVQLPFDRIVFVVDDAVVELTVDEFVALPMHERVKHLLASNLRFFRGADEVDRKTCLRALMRSDGR